MQGMENLISLIQVVKNHPKLFMNSVQNEDDNDFTEWTAIAEECKMTISEAQDQWNVLLIEYIDYLRNNRDFNLAKHMDFLQPYFFTIIESENIDEDELLNAIESKKFHEVSAPSLEQHKDEEKVGNNSLEVGKSIKIGKSEMPFTADSLHQPISTATETSRIPTHKSSFTNLSSLELIFLGYAKQLQKMPVPVQLKTKRKIADIMDEAELEIMSSNQ